MSGYTPHKNPAGQALTYNFNLSARRTYEKRLVYWTPDTVSMHITAVAITEK